MCSFNDICDICGSDSEVLGSSQVCSSCQSSSRKVKRYTPNSDVKSYREVAKGFNGKALTGTTKQKNWAEKIRADFIQNTSKTDSEITEIVEAYTSAKTWIENREIFSNL